MQKEHLLQRPHKIIVHRLKRYSLHYNIPAESCVVIPVKRYGDDVSCDVRWEDSNGVLHLRSGLIFSLENIEPINAMEHFSLYELWQHYNTDDNQKSRDGIIA